eukprot:7383774-Prymnesium_polylepis.1
MLPRALAGRGSQGAAACPSSCLWTCLLPACQGATISANCRAGLLSILGRARMSTASLVFHIRCPSSRHQQDLKCCCAPAEADLPSPRNCVTSAQPAQLQLRQSVRTAVLNTLRCAS